jgi:rhodanese-related sulfurtransferase
VIARALTLLVLGAGVGAAHSVMRPVKLHADPTAPIEIELPGGAAPVEPVPDGDGGGAAPGDPAEGVDGGEPPGSGENPDSDARGDGGEPGEFVEQRGGTLLLEDFITLDQTRILWETGVAQFIDARHLDEYAAGHIPRSVLVDPADIRAGRMPEGLMFLDFDAITVIYCGGGDCDSSENAKRDLQQMGFSQLHIFKDGFPAWEGAGLPVNVGEPGASAPRPATGGGT